MNPSQLTEVSYTVLGRPHAELGAERRLEIIAQSFFIDRLTDDISLFFCKS